jgi:hypothetical protein
VPRPGVHPGHAEPRAKRCGAPSSAESTEAPSISAGVRESFSERGAILHASLTGERANKLTRELRRVCWLLTTWLAASACGGKAGQAEGAGNGGSGNQSSGAGSGETVGSEVSGSSGAASSGGSGGLNAEGSGGDDAAFGAGSSLSVGGAAPSSAGGAAPGSDAGGASSTAGAGGEETPIDFDYPIDPAATAGCRSPVEDGCSECCVGTTADGRCDYMGAQADWSQTETEPWYHIRGVRDGPCPESCEPCAQCSLQAERGLRNFKVRPECDCATVVPVGDDCFVPNSCGCYCAQLKSTLERCPPAPG